MTLVSPLALFFACHLACEGCLLSAGASKQMALRGNWIFTIRSVVERCRKEAQQQQNGYDMEDGGYAQGMPNQHKMGIRPVLPMYAM